MHQDLEIGFPSYVTKDVIIVIESLVKSQCKGNALKHFQIFFVFFLLISFICLFPIFVSSWFLGGLVGVAKKLMKVLEIRFPTHGVMNALGIVYPQYWLQPDCDASFANLL